jgi:hypothetical protein
MSSIRTNVLRLVVLPMLAVTLFAGTPAVAYSDRYDDRGHDESRYDDRRRSGYNDEYIFAATRGVTDMDAPPYLKVPLIPLTVVLDVAILPFEVIAGLF